LDSSKPVSASAANHGTSISTPNSLEKNRFQARIVVEVVLQVAPLNADSRPPGLTPQRGLELPLEQMQQKHGQPIDQFALLGLAQALDFLGDVRHVRFRKPAVAKQRGLLVGPGVEIMIIEMLVAHSVTLLLTRPQQPISSGFRRILPEPWQKWQRKSHRLRQ
jgi:hypothetical protein